uniref:Uncharacterized protein n=1 Tax=Meloidogyne incognita TaxID=6306 RepID=A0A914LNQ1_MELIC
MLLAYKPTLLKCAMSNSSLAASAVMLLNMLTSEAWRDIMAEGARCSFERRRR